MNKLILYNDKSINILKKQNVTRCSINNFNDLKYISQILDNKYDIIDAKRIYINKNNNKDIIEFTSNRLKKNGSFISKYNINKEIINNKCKEQGLRNKYNKHNYIIINHKL